MAVPKKKTSPSRMGMRRSGHHLSYDHLVTCEDKACSGVRRPHHMCPECGLYNGRQVMVTKAVKTRLKEAAEARE
jgi:large subunit ribosomal protein L32